MTPEMSPMNKLKIRQWVKNGCPNTGGRIILKRPSAVSYPNTFVVMWKNPQVTGLTTDYICLDIHYEGDKIEAGKNFKALGGMWAKGIVGALKPQQETDELFKKPLFDIAGDKSPDPSTLENFGAY